MANGAPSSAGTRDVRVDRIEEGLPGVATVENPTANPISRATFDAGVASGGKVPKPVGVVYTDEGQGSVTQTAAVKHSQPAAW